MPRALPGHSLSSPDGTGPVGIAVTKISAKASLKICAKIDDSKPDCRTWTKVNSFKGASTDTAQSIWVVTLVGVGTDTPTVDVASRGRPMPPRSLSATAACRAAAAPVCRKPRTGSPAPSRPAPQAT